MRRFKKAALRLWLTTLFAAIAFAAGQDAADLPAGQGKNLLEVYCTTCHNLSRVQSTHVDKSTWEGIIQAMKDKRDGPMLTDEDTMILADYLAQNLGPAQPASPAASPTDAQAKQILEMNCTACHGIDLVEAKRQDKAGWDETVKGMIALGAQLPDDQIPVLVDYLAKTYGPDAK